MFDSQIDYCSLEIFPFLMIMFWFLYQLFNWLFNYDYRGMGYKYMDMIII